MQNYVKLNLTMYVFFLVVRIIIVGVEKQRDKYNFI